MSFVHDTGVYNVHASFIAWLQGKLIANVAPAVGSAVYLNLDHPTQPLHPPDISVYWLGAWDDPEVWQGGHVDGGKVGQRRWDICEIDVWVTRQHTDWRGELAQLTDTVTKALRGLLSAGSAITIYDFYTSASSPAATAYTVHLSDVATKPTPADPNPDIERVRLQVTLWWVERV